MQGSLFQPVCNTCLAFVDQCNARELILSGSGSEACDIGLANHCFS